MSTKSPKVPEDEELLAREAEVLRLRRQGYNLEEIASRTGYTNASGAYKALQRALKRYPASEADAYRAFQNAQLDELEEQTWKIYREAMDSGELELALKAQDRVQKWMDRRAKLNGIDAPVKTEVDVKGGGFVPVAVPANRLPAKAVDRLERERLAEAEKLAGEV